MLYAITLIIGTPHYETGSKSQYFKALISILRLRGIVKSQDVQSLSLIVSHCLAINMVHFVKPDVRKVGMPMGVVSKNPLPPTPTSGSMAGC